MEFRGQTEATSILLAHVYRMSQLGVDTLIKKNNGKVEESCMQYVVRSDSIKLYIAYYWLCTKTILNTCLMWNRNCLFFPEHMRSLPVLLGFVLLNHQFLCTIQWTSFRNCSLSYFIFYPFHFLCTMLMLQRVVLGKCLPIYVRLIILDLSFDYMSLIFN